jgi:UDP-N-acetylglucosamine--N-acetylmuramyl-(pentapeptide) pyrophosphoryl-undecaprenol N-acetylglucosamine transferase
VPALAVAAALRAEGAEVCFVGGARAEAELVPEAGYELHQLNVRGIDRRNPVRAAGAVGRAVGAGVRARSLLGRLQADAVLGGGGYVAGVVGAAAVSRRLALVLTEADSHLGLSNRALARFADRVCLAFPIAGLTDARYRVTGRPGPAPVTDRAGARERMGIGPDEPSVLVFGGSLGARSINEAAVEALAGAGFHVLHVTGTRDHRDLAGIAPGGRYELRDYLDSESFSRALAACDLVVARAGGSIFEVAAHGRPAILVPYPHATGNHQTANARWMERAGAAVMIDDSQLTPARLADEVAALLGDPGRLAAMARASASLARPAAAQDIASEVLAAAARHRGRGRRRPGRGRWGPARR